MICPGCQTDRDVTEKNYGALYTCPECQAVYFINFDGQPEYGDMSEQAPGSESESEPLNLSPMDNVSPVEAAESPPNETYLPMEENGAVFEDISSVNPFANMGESNKQSQIESDGAESVPAFNQIAQNITDFGNQDVQIAAFNYNLKISGLDTQELRALFKEAIDDSRFGWDATDLMRTIKNGEIEIIKLNPVQAYVLAKRLQFVDIEKMWVQNEMG